MRTVLPGRRVVAWEFFLGRQRKQQRGEQFPRLRIGWQQTVGLPLAVDQFLPCLGNAQQVHHRPANAGAFALDHQDPVLTLPGLEPLDVQLQRQRQVRGLLGQWCPAGAGAQQQDCAE